MSAGLVRAHRLMSNDLFLPALLINHLIPVAIYSGELTVLSVLFCHDMILAVNSEITSQLTRSLHR